MKNSRAYQIVVLCVTVAICGVERSGAVELKGSNPTLDPQGRFWVYRNGPNHPHMPFTPYGWMSDVTNDLSRTINVDLNCRERPHLDSNAGSTPERDCCMRFKFTWGDASWVSVAFIAGPDQPPWWGDTDKGTHYNLTGLGKRRLVFYARGQNGGECIRAQVGVLFDKTYGDSLSKPLRSEELKLGTDWARYEIDLKNVPDSELSAVCNGFGVYAERACQSGTSNEIQFFVDDVYFE